MENVVRIGDHISVRTQQDELFKKLHKARYNKNKEDATWMMIDTLAAIDAHFRLNQKYYE